MTHVRQVGPNVRPLTPVLIEHRRSGPTARPTAFLDRDGVLIENRQSYVRGVADVRVLSAAPDAVALLLERGFQIVVVTNQAGVGKGVLDLEEAIAIDRHVVDGFGPASRAFLATYLCPHRPGDRCPCRKPGSAMIEAAITRYGIPRDRCFMVGDAPDDIRAGTASGLPTTLVRSGRATEADLAWADGRVPVRDDVLKAVRDHQGAAYVE